LEEAGKADIEQKLDNFLKGKQGKLSKA